MSKSTESWGQLAREGSGIPVDKDNQREDEEAVGNEDGKEDAAHSLLPRTKLHCNPEKQK
jgi:hypothetical protein